MAMQPTIPPQPGPQPVPNHAPAPTNQGLAEDENSGKVLLSQTVTQIEAAFAATANKPRQRALELQRIKAAYLKTKYNVELKAQASE